MNLRKIANKYTQKINPNTLIEWKRSTGYASNEDFEQVPGYESVKVYANIQAMSGADLRQAEALNLQGTMRKVYLYGDVRAISRPDAVGGDLLIFSQTPNDKPQVWLVSQVSETWPDWCSVIVTLQMDEVETEVEEE